MCAMFMSKGDKSGEASHFQPIPDRFLIVLQQTALSDVFAHLKNKDNVDQVELAKLQKLYGIA